MITRFRVSNYKALRDVTLALSPVHVLIGPNDSGKTSIMEALAALCRSVDHQLQDAFTGPWQGLDLVWQRGETKTIGFEVDVELDATSFRYQLGCRPTPTGRGMQIVYENVVSLNRENDLTTTGSNGTRVWRTLTQGDAATDEIRMAAKLVHDGLSGVHFYRWTPDFLGLPAAADSSRRFRMEPSGFGLARFLDDILGFDPKRFLDLERRFTDIFPEFRAIRLVPEPAYRIPPNVEQIPLLQKVGRQRDSLRTGWQGADDSCGTCLGRRLVGSRVPCPIASSGTIRAPRVADRRARERNPSAAVAGRFDDPASSCPGTEADPDSSHNALAVRGGSVRARGSDPVPERH
jgi:energy-coupling factor transporter ATP-binding protein EcfA2